MEFESFEQMMQLIGEFHSLTCSEQRLREGLRAEAVRADAAETSRDAAERAAAEARCSAAAAAAAATHAVASLSKAHDDYTALKLRLELSERQRLIVEERFADATTQISSLKREIQQLRPLQTSQTTLQRQYTELQERIRIATNDAQREAARLEEEVRSVTRAAEGGAEVRARARLAAAAHVRDARLAADELQHTTADLHAANADIARLGALILELQHQISNGDTNSSKKKDESEYDAEMLSEVRRALEAEREGSKRLEHALRAAVAENAALAAALHDADHATAAAAATDADADAAATAAAAATADDAAADDAAADAAAADAAADTDPNVDDTAADVAHPNNPARPEAISTTMCPIDYFLAD